jgi:rod shape-determining protein MreD
VGFGLVEIPISVHGGDGARLPRTAEVDAVATLTFHVKRRFESARTDHSLWDQRAPRFRCREGASVGYCATRSPPFDRHLKDRAGGRDLRLIRRGPTRSMTLLLAAVGSTVMALMELTVGPYLRFGLAEPHLVLVLGIVVTVAIGLEAGLVWAFVGGLVLDVLAQRPLGSTAFALLLCTGATAVLGRLLVRLRPVVPILATVLLSLTYSMILYLAFTSLGSPIPVTDPVGILLPGAVYDAVLAALIGPLAISIHDRRTETERMDW